MHRFCDKHDTRKSCTQKSSFTLPGHNQAKHEWPCLTFCCVWDVPGPKSFLNRAPTSLATSSHASGLSTHRSIPHTGIEEGLVLSNGPLRTQQQGGNMADLLASSTAVKIRWQHKKMIAVWSQPSDHRITWVGSGLLGHCSKIDTPIVFFFQRAKNQTDK